MDKTKNSNENRNTRDKNDGNNNETNRVNNNHENTSKKKGVSPDDKKDEKYMRKLLKLKANNAAYVHDDHWSRHESRTKQTKKKRARWYTWRPGSHVVDVGTTCTDDEINKAIIYEQALLFARIDDEKALELDWEMSKEYLNLFHPKNYNNKWRPLAKKKRKYRQIIIVIMVRLFIADSFKQHGQFKFKADTVYDMIYKLVDDVFRHRKAADADQMLSIMRTIEKGRFHFNKNYFEKVRGNGLDNADKQAICLSENESILNGLVRNKMLNFEMFELQQLKKKYQDLQNVFESFKQKISQRRQNKGSYSYEYALALRLLHSEAPMTEEVFPKHIQRVFQLLPQSLHECDIIPTVPCRTTISLMIDVCNEIHLRMVIINGSPYSFGIGTDGGEMPSKVNKKLLPLIMTSKFDSKHKEDWKLLTFLRFMQPKDKVSETGQIIAELITEQLQAFPTVDYDSQPLCIVLSCYFGDTASNEQNGAKRLRLGETVAIPPHIFTRLMCFLPDLAHIIEISGSQSIKVVTGVKMTKGKRRQVDNVTYFLKTLHKVIPGIREVNEKFLNLTLVNSVAAFTSTGGTRFLGHNNCIQQLIFTSWMTPDQWNVYKQQRDRVNHSNSNANDNSIDSDNNEHNNDLNARATEIKKKMDIRKKQERNARRAMLARDRRAKQKAKPTSTDSTPAIKYTKRVSSKASNTRAKTDKCVSTLNDNITNNSNNLKTSKKKQTNINNDSDENDDEDAKNETVSDENLVYYGDSVVSMSDSDDGSAPADQLVVNEYYEQLQNNDDEKKNGNEDSDVEMEDQVIREMEDEFDNLAALRLNRNMQCAVWDPQSTSNENTSNDNVNVNENMNKNSCNDNTNENIIGNIDNSKTMDNSIIHNSNINNGNSNESNIMKDKNGGSENSDCDTNNRSDIPVVEIIELIERIQQHPIIFDNDGKKRDYYFDLLIKMVYAIVDYLDDSKIKKKPIDIDRCEFVIQFLWDIVNVASLFVSYQNSDISLIPLMNFVKSNNGSGRAIQMHTKFFEGIREMEIVRQAVLRKKIDAFESENIRLAAEIIKQTYNRSSIWTELCYLNLQSGGGLSSCNNKKSAGFHQCVDHKPNIPGDSNLIYFKSLLPPSLKAFEEDLLVWNKLNPNMLDASDANKDNKYIEKYFHAWIAFTKSSTFGEFLTLDDNVARETADAAFWIMSYISISWMIYKITQKFNTCLRPDIAVPCAVCDPQHGREYSKAFVDIGKGKLIEKTFSGLDFKSKDEFLAFINDLYINILHRTNLVWMDGGIWEGIKAFSNNDDKLEQS